MASNNVPGDFMVQPLPIVDAVDDRDLSHLLPGLTLKGLLSMIDHTVLALDATEDDVRLACTEALAWGAASVCVRPEWVPLAAELLRGSRIRVCTVISFHEGTDDLAKKRSDTLSAIAAGAQEIDWVFTYRNIPSCFEEDHPANLVRLEIEAISQLVQSCPAVTFKVIIETCALENCHKAWITKLLAQSQHRPQFVKTSTGFGTPRADGVPKGATASDVGLLYGVAAVIVEEGAPMRVKASGGIKKLADAIAMIVAGARRLGIGAPGVRDIVRELATA